MIKRARLGGWPVLIGFACLYALSMGRGFYSSDGEVMFKTTAALVERHTLALAADPGLPQIVPGQGGKFYSKYDPGLPGLAVPFYVAGDWIATVNAAHRYRVAAVAVLLLPTIAAAGALTGLARLLDNLGESPGNLKLILLAAGLATPLWVYARTLFAETLLALALTWAVVALGAGRGRRVDWLRAGVCIGLGLVTRAALVVYIPALIWLGVRGQTGERWPPRIRQVIWFGMGIAPFGLVLAWHNALRFGHVFEFGYTDERFTTSFWVGTWGLLFSPGKSVILYAPPLALSVVLWPRFWRTYRALGEFLLVAWGSALGFYGAWWAWHGGWCWGPRLLVPLLPLSCLPLIMLEARRGWRVLAWGLVGVGILVQLLGVLTDITPYYAAHTPDDVTDYATIHYDVSEAPLIYALKRVRTGDTEPLALFHLADTGLPPTWTVGFPALLVVGMIASAVVLFRRE